MKCFIKLSMLLFLSLFATISSAQTVKLGVYTSDKPSTMYIKFKPIVDYLSKDLSTRLNEDIKVELKIYKTYQQAQDALIKGEYEFARFGPASYIIVKEKQPNVKLLVMESIKGKKRFNGVIITRANSQIKSLSDLKGKRFAFGNKDSTIGRYLAQNELLKVGIRGQDLKSYKYLGRHDTVFKAVSLGDFDVGSIKESTLKKYNKDKVVRVIHEFQNVTKPWLARAALDERLFQALKQSLLGLKDKKILKSHKVEGFFDATDEDYDFVREGMSLSRQF